MWSVSGTETVQVSYCLFISVLSLEIELSEGVWTFDPITVSGLSLSHFCSCPKPGAEFSMSYVVVFCCCFQWVDVRGDWYWWNYLIISIHDIVIVKFVVGSMLPIFFSSLRCVVLLCFVCLRSVSCMPKVASVSELSIRDCPFWFL